MANLSPTQSGFAKLVLKADGVSVCLYVCLFVAHWWSQGSNARTWSMCSCRRSIKLLLIQTLQLIEKALHIALNTHSFQPLDFVSCEDYYLYISVSNMRAASTPAAVFEYVMWSRRSRLFTSTAVPTSEILTYLLLPNLSCGKAPKYFDVLMWVDLHSTFFYFLSGFVLQFVVLLSEQMLQADNLVSQLPCIFHCRQPAILHYNFQ